MKNTPKNVVRNRDIKPATNEDKDGLPDPVRETAQEKPGENDAVGEDRVRENRDVALTPICSEKNETDAPPTKALGDQEGSEIDNHEGLPPPAADPGPEADAAPPLRIPQMPPLPHEEVDDEWGDLPDDDPPPRRIRRPLEQLFRRIRRFRRNPPTSKVVETLVAAGEDRAGAEGFVHEFGAVFEAALKTCGNNRQATFVLAAMELLCRQGRRDHSEREITDLTGQRLHVVRQALEYLCREGIADVGSLQMPWRGGYELIHPLKVGPQQLGSFQDPIELLRLEEQQLKALPADEFNAIAIDAAQQVAEDHLSKQESEIVLEIGRCRELEATEEDACNAASARLKMQRERIRNLKSELSRVRWRRRHPFKVEAPEDEANP